jgi:hypothetical protein
MTLRELIPTKAWTPRRAGRLSVGQIARNGLDVHGLPVSVFHRLRMRRLPKKCSREWSTSSLPTIWKLDYLPEALLDALGEMSRRAA